MNLTMMLLLNAYPHDAAGAAAPLTWAFAVAGPSAPGPGAPRPQDPGPEGGEGESVGDEDDGESEPKPAREGDGGPKPAGPPATPDANPIDPRVFGSIH